MRSLEERFFEKVRHVDDPLACWEWSQTKSQDGYGRFHITAEGGRYIRQQAHRWAYEFLIAPIPDGLQIDHLCRNRGCVNPWHLEPVTGSVNSIRSNRDRTPPKQLDWCRRGLHRMSESARVDPRTGKRQCNPCKMKRQAERKKNLAAVGSRPVVL